MTRRGATTVASVGISLAIGVAALLSFLTPPDRLVVVAAEMAPQVPAMGKTTLIALPPPPAPQVAEVLVPETLTPLVEPLQSTEPVTAPAPDLVIPTALDPVADVAEIDPIPLTPPPVQDLVVEKAPVVIEITALAEGRALLRILEHGAGPSIEIAWPSASQDRARLFEVFQSCLGMQVAVMDTQGNVFRDDGQPGKRWDIDLDRFSGFVRQPMGDLTVAEAAIVRAATTRHRGINGPTAIRIFPRNADALLLGGMRQIVGGGNYENIGTIHAVYRLNGNAVIVDSIIADGRAMPGNIPLSAASEC